MAISTADQTATLASAAGYDDAERWWEDVVEHRHGGLAVFAPASQHMGDGRIGKAGVVAGVSDVHCYHVGCAALAVIAGIVGCNDDAAAGFHPKCRVADIGDGDFSALHGNRRERGVLHAADAARDRQTLADRFFLGGKLLGCGGRSPEAEQGHCQGDNTGNQAQHVRSSRPEPGSELG